MASGKMRAVITTRNSDNPSTPTCHEMPQPEIHSYCCQNWKTAAEPASNSASTHTASTADTVEATRATGLNRSGLVRGIASSTRAPATGTSTSTVRAAGKDVEASAPI